jgi:hypothetical protein
VGIASQLALAMTDTNIHRFGGRCARFAASGVGLAKQPIEKCRRLSNKKETTYEPLAGI